MTINLLPDVSELFNLKFERIPTEANMEMLVLFGFMVISTYLL